MKKKLFVLLSLLGAFFLLTGCGENAEEKTPTKLSLSGVSQNSEVDVDLTQISETVRFAEIYNMIIDPETDEGKTARTTGEFRKFPAMEEGGSSYYSIVVQDAGACCIQGLEVILEEGSTASYPESGSMVTVDGVFETYQLNTVTLCRLRVQEFQIDRPPAES